LSSTTGRDSLLGFGGVRLGDNGWGRERDKWGRERKGKIENGENLKKIPLILRLNDFGVYENLGNWEEEIRNSKSWAGNFIQGFSW